MAQRTEQNGAACIDVSGGRARIRLGAWSGR